METQKCWFCLKHIRGNIVELFRHQFAEHKCYICEHHYIKYGCELECELLEKNKPCKFKFNKKG